MPPVAAFFGSGRQQVACDEKFSAEPDSGDEEEEGWHRVAGGRVRGSEGVRCAKKGEQGSRG